ncbi:MAG: hypothetical protein JWN76_3497 [Chitinophagaceae bacterium]|nr:hypothetical protein [Chitinophagaceae bacterium]
MFPKLLTERFVLRQIISNDQQQIFEGLSHPEVIKYYGVSYKTFEETKAQMNFYDDLLTRETGIWWGVCYKNNIEKIIGACGFNYWKKEHYKTEIGYWLLPGEQRGGVMSECLPIIINYAFTVMKVHRIEALVETENERSLELLNKLGFKQERILKDAEIKNSRYISLTAFALIS